MGRFGGFGLVVVAILACSCGRSLPGGDLLGGTDGDRPDDPGSGGSGGSGGGVGRGGSGGSSSGSAGTAGDDPGDEPDFVPLCSHGRWTTEGSVALYGRDGEELHVVTAAGAILNASFPITADQSLGQGGPEMNITFFHALAKGELHTVSAAGMTALYGDESAREPSSPYGRVKRFAAALVGADGELRYATNGSVGGRGYADSVSELRLSDAGELTVDLRAGADFTGGEPVPDLLLDASGGFTTGYRPVLDADGWARAPFGLYHPATGRRLERPETERLTHGEQAGLYAVASVEKLDDAIRVTVFDARSEATYDLPGIFNAYAAIPTSFVAPGVLAVLDQNLPMFRIDTLNRRVTPLLAGVDSPRLVMGFESYTWRETFRANLYDDPGDEIVDSFLVDPAKGTVVRLSAIGISAAATISQSRDVWLISEGAILRAAVRRDTGEVTSYPSPSASDVRVAGSDSGRALYLADGLPWAELDVQTAELRRFDREKTAGLDPVDEVARHGDFMVGSAGGLPRWTMRAGGDSFVRLPPAGEAGLEADVEYRGDVWAAGEPSRETEWLLFHQGNVPRAALALPDGAVHEFEPEIADALPHTDEVEVAGAWAFGFVRSSYEREGQEWLDARRVVWRAHLPSGNVTIVPDVPGYVSLFDDRYVLSPGSNLSYYMLDRDFSFSDGTIAVVRRDDAAARVFVLGAESETFAPIGEPFTHVVGVNVEHGPGYFVVSPEHLDCYCQEPGLDWGSGEPDTSRQRQLVLEEEGSLRTVTGGDWTFTADSSCVAVASETGGYFVRDFLAEKTLTLPAATAWFWLEPEQE